MNLNERNYAGDHVVVGSLEVLGDVKGGAIKQIRRSIDLVQQQAEVINRTQERYWEELSSDSMITPLEKQQLLKEFKSIQQSYTAIYSQAVSIGQESSEYVQDYIATYNDLYSYLYTALHLFDDMTTVTDIENRQTFNTKFFNYYYSESFVLVALSKGLLDSVSIRVLDSLLDEGEEGDVGIYHGALYQYVNGAWKNVSTGNYKGALDSLPLAEQDAFFLASDNFIVSQELWVNGQQLQINDGNGLDALVISRLFRKGYIYYCQDGAWFEQSDKTNYMYVAAFADVLNITGELPQIFQDAIDDLQQQIDNNRVPKYRGPSATNPLNPVEDDFFVYSGTTTVTRRNSDIYQYKNGEWVRLDPLQSQNSPYYMQALDDILQLNNTDNGYFAALFAQALFANNAFLYALSTTLITLRGPDGYIQSDNYDPEHPESAGFRVSHNGDADFNGDTHIAGKVAIGVPLRGNTDFAMYNSVIGGNTLLKDVNIRGNATIETDVLIRGNIDSGPLHLSNERPSPTVYSSKPANSWWNKVDWGHRVNGYFGSINYYDYTVERYEVWQQGIGTEYARIRLYNNEGAIVYEKVMGWEDYAYDHNSKTPYDQIAYTMIEEGTKTMQLRNLPTSQPSGSGMVWNDNGYLKVTSE